MTVPHGESDGVGHELRAALTLIKVAVDTLRDPTIKLAASDQEELLSSIVDGVNRLTLALVAATH